MFKAVWAAGAAAMTLTTFGGSALAAEIPIGFEFFQVGTIDEFGDVTSPGSAEVGGYTYVERDEFDVVDRVDVDGVVHLGVATDFGDPADTVPPPLYLTFDIQHQGGLHEDGDFGDVYFEGNQNSPFTGQIRIAYGEYGNFFGHIDGPVTTLATIDISPDWADVGESFSFNIYNLISGYPSGGREFTFLFDTVGPIPVNTAWTFNNFRITTTDQTSAVPGAAVPEPGTWALMILGFGAVGGAMRSRRTQLSRSAA
jgi:hypothetical protein